MKKIEKALTLSRQAIGLLEVELDLQKRGKGTTGTAVQLEMCMGQLQKMIIQLEQSQLPPKNQRLLGMGHMIADSWPVNSKLGEALLLAEQAYRAAP